MGMIRKPSLMFNDIFLVMQKMIRFYNREFNKLLCTSPKLETFPLNPLI